MTYIAPNLFAPAFTCPHCGVLSRQEKWGYDLNAPSGGVYRGDYLMNAPLKLSRCDNCSENCIWVGENHVYPATSSAPTANPDMPESVRADYSEASNICASSPRGAAALLRLAVQKLMVHLGQPGKNINDDIASLVASGLPKPIQQALDVVRITGNNAVHPGQLDADDVAIAQQLFPLVNLIVEYQISIPARVDAIYSSLPSGALAGIEQRDAVR